MKSSINAAAFIRGNTVFFIKLSEYNFDASVSSPSSIVCLRPGGWAGDWVRDKFGKWNRFQKMALTITESWIRERVNLKHDHLGKFDLPVICTWTVLFYNLWTYFALKNASRYFKIDLQLTAFLWQYSVVCLHFCVASFLMVSAFFSVKKAISRRIKIQHCRQCSAAE